METTLYCKLPRKKQSTNRLEIALQILCTCKLIKNLLYVVILKILLFLNFSPASLIFLKRISCCFGVLFKNSSEWTKSFVHQWDLTLKSQQRPKSFINSLLIKQKWNYTFLILTYRALTSTVRGSLRRICQLILGLQGLRTLWL